MKEKPLKSNTKLLGLLPTSRLAFEVDKSFMVTHHFPGPLCSAFMYVSVVECDAADDSDSDDNDDVNSSSSSDVTSSDFVGFERISYSSRMRIAAVPANAVQI